jgi:hypothetical protein
MMSGTLLCSRTRTCTPQTLGITPACIQGLGFRMGKITINKTTRRFEAMRKQKV